jgi:hypothetical protein
MSAGRGGYFCNGTDGIVVDSRVERTGNGEAEVEGVVSGGRLVVEREGRFGHCEPRVSVRDVARSTRFHPRLTGGSIPCGPPPLLFYRARHPRPLPIAPR